MCGRSLVIGVFFAAAVSALGCTRQTPQTPQDIIFAGKTFYDPGKKAAFVAVSGTLTGPGVAYENNSTLVVCYADMKECLTYSVEQIGPNQIGSLQLPISYPSLRWNEREIVAAGSADAFNCSKLTITIVRSSGTTVWVTEPINQSRPECLKANTTIKKWTLEDSPAWKVMFKKPG